MQFSIYNSISQLFLSSLKLDPLPLLIMASDLTQMQLISPLPLGVQIREDNESLTAVFSPRVSGSLDPASLALREFHVCGPLSQAVLQRGSPSKLLLLAPQPCGGALAHHFHL